MINHPRLKGLVGKARRAELQRIRRGENKALGLRYDGVARRNKKWDCSPEEKLKLRVRHYRSKLYARGLTSRGGQRKKPYGYFPVTQFGFTGLSEREIAYRKLREEMKP